MAPDRIVDAAQLANAVDALSVGLQTFDDSTKQMETICSSFQERLGQLEAEMRPMKMISQKLSAARRHVSEAVDEMEKVNEYFTLEAEKREAITKGCRGCSTAKLEEYVEDVRRILEAMAFFRDFPSLRSQASALAGLKSLCDTAAGECLEEFSRLMKAVGPAVQHQAAAGGYEPVVTLSDNSAAALATVGEALELLGRRAALRQGYASARRVTAAATLRNWVERYEAGAAGQEARGGGDWLRAYLDFAVKLVAGERLLWEQVLSVNSLRQRDPPAEEAFLSVVSSVVDKLVHDVDTNVQATLMELRTMQSDKDGTAHISTLLRGTSEKTDKLRSTGAGGGSSSSAAEGDRRVEAMVSLLEMGDTLHRGAALLLRVLRMGKDDHNALTKSLAGLESRLCQAALQSCTDLVDAVRMDSTSKKNVPENAAVHVLTSNTLRAVKRIMPFREGYETLAAAAPQKMPWDILQEAAGASGAGPQQADSCPAGSVPLDAEHSAAAEKCPCFTHFVNHVVRQLIDNLVDKSRTYLSGRANEARRHLFLLNNANYLLANARMASTQLAQASIGASHHSVLSLGSGKADLISTIFRPLSPAPGLSSSKRPSPFEKSSADSGAASSSSSGSTLTPRTLKRNTAVDAFFSGAADKRPVDEGGLLSIAHFLTAHTQWLLKRIVQEKVMAYSETLFDPLAHACADDVGNLDFGRGKLLSLECGRLIKAKFSNFNEAWEEIYNSQRTVNVGDSAMKQKLVDEARRRIVVPYRELYDSYKDVQFSKKHQGDYLKHTPDAIAAGIEELFQG